MRIEGSSIKMEVDGRPVCARLLQAKTYFLAIELVEPLPGLVDGTPNVPSFARPHCPRFVGEEGELTEEGRRRARRLVEKLVRAVRAFEAHGEELRALVLEARAIAEAELAPEAPLDNEGFRKERKILRRQLRREGLGPHAYQRRLEALKSRNRAWHAVDQRVQRRLHEHLDREHGLCCGLDFAATLIETFELAQSR